MVNPPLFVFPGSGSGQRPWPAGFSGSLSPVTSFGTLRLSAQHLSSAAPAVTAVPPLPEIHNQKKVV